MKILMIGGNGTIGKVVFRALNQEHQVIVAGRTQGDHLVDIADTDSISQLFEKIGNVDALVCIAGEAKWGAFSELSEQDYYIGIRSKLMGQVNLVRLGLKYLNPGGSFTLTTGILADDPVAMTASAAMVNGALHSFTKAVALELDQDRRINVVAAGLVEDAVDKYRSYFPGHDPVSMERVTNGYLKSVLGKINGSIIRVY